MDKTTKKRLRRDKIRRRIRSTIRGTEERPRLSVFKSNKHIYAQLINDRDGLTIAAASTLSTDLEGDLKGKTKVEQSKLVGDLLAKKAEEAGVKKAVFDRSGYKYHGKVKAVADGAREGGLEF